MDMSAGGFLSDPNYSNRPTETDLERLKAQAEDYERRAVAATGSERDRLLAAADDCRRMMALRRGE